MTVWRMRIVCCITEATNTHSEYVILIAFHCKMVARTRLDILPCMYISCLLRLNKLQELQCSITFHDCFV